MHKPLTDVQVLRGEEEENYGDREEHSVMTNHWKRQYMRGVSTTTSQGGVYYEALKGSSNSVIKGCVIFNHNKNKTIKLNYFQAIEGMFNNSYR